MALRDMMQRMRADIRAAYKSEDTEEWFDRVFTKPLGYLWALLFMRLGWTPNQVTLLSLVIGVAGGLMLLPVNLGLNIAGVLLVIFANILDSTDGQIARLTHQTSTLGRLLDAMSTTAWSAAMYVALCVRIMPQTVPFLPGAPVFGWWIWPLCALSAFAGHQRQGMMADYYRNIHLYFLKGAQGSELDTAADIAARRAALPKAGNWFPRMYLFFYRFYTRAQELSTPWFQRLRASLRAAYGDDIPDDIRQAYLARSRKYIQLTNILTFNTRTYALFACVLLNVPLHFIAFELFVLGALSLFMRARYERIARDLYYQFHLPGSESGPQKKRVYPVIFFLAGVAGIAVMLCRMDLSHIEWDTIFRLMPLWVPMLLGVWALIYFIHALSYRLMMGSSGKKVRMGRLFRVTLSSFAINHVTPMGLMGGEPYRIMELKPRVGVAKATASTLTFTVMFIASHVLFWLTGTVVYFVLFGLEGGFARTLLMALIGVCCAAGGALFLFTKRQETITALLRFSSRLPLIGRVAARFLAKNAATLGTIDREIFEIHRHRGRFWLTVLLEYAARLLEAAEYFMIFQLLGAGLTFAQTLFSLMCASLLGNLMFFLPMQLGAREGGLALALGWMSIPASFGVTASLLARFREILYVVIGILMIVVRRGDAMEESGAEDSPDAGARGGEDAPVTESEGEA